MPRGAVGTQRLAKQIMNNGIFIIAHAPLATALRQCALHVYPDAAPRVVAFDVAPTATIAETLGEVRNRMGEFNLDGVLVLTDVFGATPCNVAQALPDGVHVRLLAGVNLPMLLRAVNYLDQPLEDLSEKALAGGAQGMMQVSCAPHVTSHTAAHD